MTTTASELSGGAEPELDEVTAHAPADPTFREGVSIWVWDDAGEVCLPRIGVEAVGATWSASFETAICMATPEGRLLLASSDDPPKPPLDGAGRPRIIGSGPLTFQCVAPFAHWRIEFDGAVVVTDVERLLAGGVPKVKVGTGHAEVALKLSIDAQMVLPPWFQGTQEPRGHHVVGERRFEQLCTATGTIEVDGAGARSFTGGGLRVHRKGGARNDYGDFHGHVWQSAHFPSGRAFGFIHYRSGPDGAPRYCEGWLQDDGERLPARVEHTPWLGSVQASGERVSFTLRTSRRAIEISGTTIASSFRPPRATTTGATFPTLQSGIARYRWDEEEALGMIERSARL